MEEFKDITELMCWYHNKAMKYKGYPALNQEEYSMFKSFKGSLKIFSVPHVTPNRRFKL